MDMSRFARAVHWILTIPVLSGSLFAAGGPPPRIDLSVDATEAPRKIFHARLKIPASPGILTLYYPEWIPGNHEKTGAIEDLGGLQFTANGKVLTWRRDLLDGWVFHIDVPAGASMVEASLDFLSPATIDDSDPAESATARTAILNWNTLLLYPAGWTSDELTYNASLRLPRNWKFGTSLTVASQSADDITFSPTSLTMLVDSPVIAGQHFRVVPLTQHPVVELDIAADSAAALDAPPEVFGHYKALVDQAQKLFGAYHFREYHFLYSLSDHVAHFGIEHHESTDSRKPERALVDPELRLLAAGLLPHEYVHSWNGKYRRPIGLSTANFEIPMQTDLLWVYEGLTSYLGDILSARSALRTPQEFRDTLAMAAADLDHRPGRTWRNLQDTADGLPAMHAAPDDWMSWRRPTDYYDEDILNWLWVDTIIREQTHNAKTIDTFCQMFFGPPGGPPTVKTYTFDDLVNGLNQTAAYDWRRFWNDRLTTLAPKAPVDGIERSGWKVVYDENPGEDIRAEEDKLKKINASYSIGLSLRSDGTIVDTVEGMSAALAGIGPGMKVIAVNGRGFSSDVLREALRATKDGDQSLQLLIENTDYYATYELDYHGGEKYPHLVRSDARPDILGEIIAPR
jgi:predicted metalloprotease with PDZ domain